MTKLEVLMVGVTLLLAFLCVGCAPAPVVYGFHGPAIQNEVYHPVEDPLMKYWEEAK